MYLSGRTNRTVLIACVYLSYRPHCPTFCRRMKSTRFSLGLGPGHNHRVPQFRVSAVSLANISKMGKHKIATHFYIVLKTLMQNLYLDVLENIFNAFRFCVWLWWCRPALIAPRSILVIVRRLMKNDDEWTSSDKYFYYADRNCLGTISA